jgi:hypothetical protein
LAEEIEELEKEKSSLLLVALPTQCTLLKAELSKLQ